MTCGMNNFQKIKKKIKKKLKKFQKIQKNVELTRGTSLTLLTLY